MPSHKLDHARTTARLATGVAKNLIDSKSEALLQGKGNRDIMSLLGEIDYFYNKQQCGFLSFLVKANASEDERTQMNEDEMLSQMR